MDESAITSYNDVLDELMGLDNELVNTCNVLDNKKNSTLNASSINLEEIMNRRPLKDIIDDRENDIATLMVFIKDIIASTVDKLNETINFLKNELDEKNLLIRALIFQNANNMNGVDIGLLESDISPQAQSSHDTSSEKDQVNCGLYRLVDYDETINEDSMEDVNSFTDDTLYSQPLNSTDTTNRNDITTSSSSSSEYEKNGRHKYSNIFTWERHSSGIASKILDRMGYQGNGLGKQENGITETITIKNSYRFEKKGPTKRKIFYILSDSMMNGIDEKRISNNKIEVKVECHGGCTVERMFTHLDTLVKYKPDYVLLHVGTNNCTNSTSDEMLRELKHLKEHIQLILPSTRIYISSPTVRTDNNKANIIIKNVNIKLKKLGYILLDNSNIRDYHLGKKGLHFNNNGTKQMARNIISFIKRL